MAKVEQCPGFETFGADVKTAREKLGISRRELAEKIGVDPRYLANIELNATIPSMPLVVQLFHLCRLPAEKYFNPELRKQETEQYQRNAPCPARSDAAPPHRKWKGCVP